MFLAKNFTYFISVYHFVSSVDTIRATKNKLCESVNLCELLISHRCPAGYSGLSCESCSPGFERVPGPYLGICAGCNCNGHASACDPISGHCLVRISVSMHYKYADNIRFIS